ncbi:hypothetical protein B0H13DRAFT_2559645 [Mycena leptocephala]|nr:hypothetical protein B0H13DRAFT_2559645 [Mycena leptocephala]
MNIVNLIFFESRDTTLQCSASSLGFAVTMIFSSRFILNLSERAMDGVTGDHSHSSRAPGPELVTVVKNVPDDESARQVKGGKWGAEDAMA